MKINRITFFFILLFLIIHKFMRLPNRKTTVVDGNSNFTAFLCCCFPASMVFSSAEVQPTRYRFLAGAVFLSLVSFTLSFSRGASYASCRDMVPGHISTHPLDPRQNHITLRTSSSSYLPGQLLIGEDPAVARLSHKC